ncbi:MAG: cupin domain-containing protein [Spirochaetales bacterium]|nr:cupin domain-containing protein [Spirochaetales bacterium]
MEKTTFKEGIQLINTEKIDAKKLFTSEKCDAIQINLDPGGKIEKHSTEEDVLFYIVKGKVTASIGNEELEAEKETIIPCSAGIVKSLLNTGDEKASILVVKLK